MYKLIKIQQVMELTSLGRATIYKFMAEGKFPKQVPLSSKAVAWVYQEVEEWIEEKINQRDEIC